MGLESRLLPPLEWAKLEGTEASSVWPHLPPEAKVMVVERDSAIVGCWILLQAWHAECVWVHPDHRAKSSVARRLWNLMHATARSLGVHHVFTSATDAKVGHLLDHHGATKLPGEHYVLLIKGD